MINSSWSVSGTIYKIQNADITESSLPKGIYNLCCSETLGFYLDKVSEEYRFPEKLYSVESEFVAHALKTIQETDTNIGVLLSGLKGTGKTLTAKILSTMIGLPIIQINSEIEGWVGFISAISEPLVIMIDEYEKIFEVDGRASRGVNIANLLSFFDGSSPSSRRISILTSNDTKINEYLTSRPGRILYNKKFGDLPIEVVEEVVDDSLISAELRSDVINYISTMENITMDNIKATVREVNIHNKPPQEFASFLNINKVSPVVRAYILPNGFSQSVFSDTAIKLGKLSKVSKKVISNGTEHWLNVGANVYIDNRSIGIVQEHIGEDKYVVGVFISDEPLGKVLKSNAKDKLRNLETFSKSLRNENAYNYLMGKVFEGDVESADTEYFYAGKDSILVTFIMALDEEVKSNYWFNKTNYSLA